MRLLLIEDEPDLLQSLAQTLREEGYAVDTAEDGLDGLDKALTWDYHAIVLDGMLPRLDGWAVLERLRLRSPLPSSCSRRGMEPAAACAGLIMEPMIMW